MSCYHPLIREPVVSAKGTVIQQENGEVKYSIRKMIDRDFDQMPPGAVQIPCGNCIGCKLDHSRQWADRMLLELRSAGCGVFVTLTYGEKVPTSSYKDNNDISHKNYTLRKKDLQDFIKRLRFRYKDKRISYYCCGEYGENNLRPHYHGIFFGLSLVDLEAEPLMTPLGDNVKNAFGDLYYKSEILEQIWNNGHVGLGAVTWKSCAYVARYCTKKWSTGYDYKGKKIKRKRKLQDHVEWIDAPDGRQIIIDHVDEWIEEEVDLYEFFGVDKEFSVMSLKPAIGYSYLEDMLQRDVELLEISSIALPSGEGSKAIKVPKSFVRKHYKDSRDAELRRLYEIAIERAIGNQHDRMQLELDNTDLDYIEYLAVKESKHLSGAKLLLRDKA